MARIWGILGIAAVSQLLPEALSAQSPADSVIVRGLVSGQILDASSGTTLAGARVTITSAPEGIVGLGRGRSETSESTPFQRLSETAVTQSDGRFGMRARRLGYRPATLVVDLRANKGPRT